VNWGSRGKPEGVIQFEDADEEDFQNFYPQPPGSAPAGLHERIHRPAGPPTVVTAVQGAETRRRQTASLEVRG